MNVISPLLKQHEKTSSNILLVLVRVFAAIAFALSAYLAVVSFNAAGPAGCGGGEIVDCDHVLKSRWSGWLGIPVSVFGAATYAGIFVLSWILSLHRELRVLFRCMGFVAGLAALWFIVLQLFVIQRLCIYCLLVHGCGLTICGLIIWLYVFDYRKHRASFSWAAVPAIWAAVGLAGLVIGQMSYQPAEFEVIDMSESGGAAKVAKAGESSGVESVQRIEKQKPSAVEVPPAPDASKIDAKQRNKPATDHRKDPALADSGQARIPSDTKGDTNPTPNDPTTNSTIEVPNLAPKRRTVTVMRGSVTLDLTDFPVIGDPEADEIFVKLFDYSCPDCRRLHKQLEMFREQYQTEFAVLLAPVPMNTKCNPYLKRDNAKHVDACEYSKIALAVWMKDPAKFESFHNWMMQGQSPPSLNQAKAYAQQLTGVDDITPLMQDRLLTRHFGRVLGLYNDSNAGIVPKLFVRNRLIVGAPSDVLRMFSALNEILSGR